MSRAWLLPLLLCSAGDAALALCVVWREGDRLPALVAAIVGVATAFFSRICLNLLCVWTLQKAALGIGRTLSDRPIVLFTFLNWADIPAVMLSGYFVAGIVTGHLAVSQIRLSMMGPDMADLLAAHWPENLRWAERLYPLPFCKAVLLGMILRSANGARMLPTAILTVAGLSVAYWLAWSVGLLLAWL